MSEKVSSAPDDPSSTLCHSSRSNGFIVSFDLANLYVLGSFVYVLVISVVSYSDSSASWRALNHLDCGLSTIFGCFFTHLLSFSSGCVIWALILSTFWHSLWYYLSNLLSLTYDCLSSLHNLFYFSISSLSSAYSLLLSIWNALFFLACSSL